MLHNCPFCDELVGAGSFAVKNFAEMVIPIFYSDQLNSQFYPNYCNSYYNFYIKKESVGNVVKRYGTSGQTRKNVDKMTRLNITRPMVTMLQLLGSLIKNQKSLRQTSSSSPFVQILFLKCHILQYIAFKIFKICLILQETVIHALVTVRRFTVGCRYLV